MKRFFILALLVINNIYCAKINVTNNSNAPLTVTQVKTYDNKQHTLNQNIAAGQSSMIDHNIWKMYLTAGNGKKYLVSTNQGDIPQALDFEFDPETLTGFTNYPNGLNVERL